MDWELVLAADHVHSTLRDLANEPWKLALPHLLEDFQQLLRDALDLLRELDGADDRSDRSHWDLPSITQHWQNRGFRDWVSLIEMPARCMAGSSLQRQRSRYAHRSELV
ncbi:hypothetical protein ACSF59_18680 [Escherichia coli]|uniref:hypothetical protein n=1 Tax=Escherichia coli TaxID=562 RepID=UPI003EEC802D